MLFNLARIAVVIALPVGCLVWTAYLGGEGAHLLRGKEFGALCLGQQLFRGVDQATDCLAADWLWVFRWTAWIALGVALVPVLLFLVASLLCGANRWLNARVFPRLIPVSITLVVINIMVQGVLLLLAVTALWLAHIGNPPITAMGIALVAMVGVAGAVIVSASSVTVNPGIPVQAIKLDRDAAPQLFDLVEEISTELGARPPQNILVGFDRQIWVISSRIALTGHGLTGRVDGQTLHLSLPLMHILSMEELIGLIAHELGHFRAQDAAYTTRFLPVYTALAGARYDLDDYEDVFARKPAVTIVLTAIAKVPARALLGLLGTSFRRNARRIGRIREQEADACATEVTEPAVLARALLKAPVYDGLWEEMIEDQARRMNRLHARAVRLARHFGDIARLDMVDEDIESARKAALKLGTDHPFDRHPSMRARLRGIGVKADEIGARAMRLTEADRVAEDLIPPETLEDVEAGLSSALYHDMQARRLIRDIPSMRARVKVPVLYQSVYALLAHLVRASADAADRYQHAVSIGEREMTEFDPLIFAEYCSGRHDMPDAHTAARRIVAEAGPEAGALMRGMVDDLLESDDVEIRDWLFEALDA